MRWPWEARDEVVIDEEAPFVADAPIRFAAEDTLGRADFAKNLAKIIVKWRGDTSLVLAVRSPWGNGKTSVKNLILEDLNKRRSKPKVLQFNPWQYDGADAITAAFYRELRLALGKQSLDIDAWKRGRSLRKYGRYFTAASTGLSTAGGEVTPILAAMTAFGVATFSATYITQDNMARWGSLGVVAVGLIGIFGKLLQFFGNPEDEIPQHHARRELEGRLRKLKHPLLIVIDDLDRVDEEAIRLVIRHVKVNADLPNITYLLLFQRDIVEKALGEITGGQGRDYLDKIILAPFDLPPVGQDQVAKVLFGALDKLLLSIPANNGFDSNRWGNAYHGGIKKYFRNLRDVHRFIASISVQMTLHVSAKMVEVNIIDIFILETIRLFEPDVYAAIAEGRDLVSAAKLEKDEKDKAQELLKGAKDREAAEALIIELFPNLSVAFSTGMFFSDTDAGKWAQSRRVALGRNFDRYFSLRVPDNAISGSEFEEFVEHAGDRNYIDAAFADLKRRGLLNALMSRLDEIHDHLPIAHIETLAGALFDIGDELEEGSFLIGSSPFIACWRAASWYFHSIEDSEERSRRFLATLEQSRGLSVPATLIGLDDDRRAKGSRERLTLTDEDLLKAKEFWIEKLFDALGEPAAFLKLPRAVNDLYAARRWGKERELRTWADQTTQDQSLLLLFLQAFVSTSHSWGASDRVAKVKRYLSVKYLTDFIDLDVLSSRLAQLDRSSLSSEEVSLIDEFESKRHSKRGDDDDDM